jgi:hypothetical protein
MAKLTPASRRAQTAVQPHALAPSLLPLLGPALAALQVWPLYSCPDSSGINFPSKGTCACSVPSRGPDEKRDRLGCCEFVAIKPFVAAGAGEGPETAISAEAAPVSSSFASSRLAPLRPRVLISGPEGSAASLAFFDCGCLGNGQAWLGSALLHDLEEFPLYSLALPDLLAGPFVDCSLLLTIPG